MNKNLLDLTSRFREMSDEELLSRCRAGALNDMARPVALAELACRGLELPNPGGAAACEDAEYEGDFVTVAQFLNPIEAHIVCSCLQAARIPAIVADANLVQMNSLLAIAVGGVRIRVPATRLAEAEEVIDAFNRGDYSLPDGAESLDE